MSCVKGSVEKRSRRPVTDGSNAKLVAAEPVSEILFRCDRLSGAAAHAAVKIDLLSGEDVRVQADGQTCTEGGFSN